MVIVDTSVVIDYLADRITPHTNWLDQQASLQRIGITSLVQAEVLQGIRADKLFAVTLEILNEFEIFETGSSELAISAARNFRALRKKGVTIRSTIDCLIATFCIEEGHTLLHNDRDFDAFERHLGLRVLRPTEPLSH
jgi:predicted nucleic acid-binding protein